MNGAFSVIQIAQPRAPASGINQLITLAGTIHPGNTSTWSMLVDEYNFLAQLPGVQINTIHTAMDVRNFLLNSQANAGRSPAFAVLVPTVP